MVYSCVVLPPLLRPLSVLFFFDQVVSVFQHGPHAVTAILASLLESMPLSFLAKAFDFEFASELLLSCSF